MTRAGYPSRNGGAALLARVVGVVPLPLAGFAGAPRPPKPIREAAACGA